mmetsp:Transcript_6193/g.9417  ORF Transcript_6193/g.9417 Transcript_6193/m.9417 type:complete len:342 (-) Transcript_6193:112-1137(-)
MFGILFYLFLGLVSLLFGLVALLETHGIIHDDVFYSMWLACKHHYNNTTITDDQILPTIDLVEYEPWLGGPMSCVVTQFFHQVRTDQPAGMLAYFLHLTLTLPSILMVGVETAKFRGVLHSWFTILMLTSQATMSVVLPLLWIPSYLLFAREGPIQFSTSRIWGLVALLILPLVALSFLLFFMDLESSEWSYCAGLLGGPIAAIVTILTAWPLTSTPPSSSSEAHVVTSRYRNVVWAYRIVALLSGFLWVLWVVAMVETFDDVDQMMNVMWYKARPPVAFLSLSAMLLSIGLCMFASCRTLTGTLMSLVWFPWIGPGATIAMVLAGCETRASKLADNKKQL